MTAVVHLKKLALSVLQLTMAVGCVSFRDPHLRWIDWAEFHVSQHKTVPELDVDERYPHGAYIADHRFLTGTTEHVDGRLLYHYVIKDVRRERTCRYHLVVDTQTGVVIGYGFDGSPKDAKRTCLVSA